MRNVLLKVDSTNYIFDPQTKSYTGTLVIGDTVLSVPEDHSPLEAFSILEPHVAEVFEEESLEFTSNELGFDPRFVEFNPDLYNDERIKHSEIDVEDSANLQANLILDVRGMYTFYTEEGDNMLLVEVEPV